MSDNTKPVHVGAFMLMNVETNAAPGVFDVVYAYDLVQIKDGGFVLVDKLNNGDKTYFTRASEAMETIGQALDGNVRFPYAAKEVEK